MEELFEEIHSSCEADLYQPLLGYIHAKKMGRNTPPYIPQWDFSALHHLCKWALLWQIAGFQREAGELAYWLFKLESFPALWCPEKEYNEAEYKRLFSLLKSKIEPISKEESVFNLTLLETSRIAAALTLDGKGTSLGMIRAGGIEIRAFGPQSASLNFGISGQGMNGWTRTAAYPEVWLEMKHAVDDERLQLNFRLIGIQPEWPLSIAFYVKSQSCQIGAEVLKPKSLRRYHGEVKEVSFENKLKIESGQPHKVEVIPLAGEGCFWDCEFLVSFELHPFATQISFTIDSSVVKSFSKT